MQIEINYNDLVRKSFICGISLASISILFILIGAPLLVILSAAILPGFIYSMLVGKGFPVTQLKGLFIMFSGIINIIVAIGCPWLVDFYGLDVALFPLYGLSCAVFFCLYYFMINSSLHFKTGLLLSFIAGCASATLQVLVGKEGRFFSNIISSILLITPIPIWQTLFAVVLKISAKKL